MLTEYGFIVDTSTPVADWVDCNPLMDRTGARSLYEGEPLLGDFGLMLARLLASFRSALAAPPPVQVVGSFFMGD